MLSPRCRFVFVAALFWATLAFSVKAKTESDQGFDFFEKKIRPVLVTECYKCHSAKSAKVKGGLLLDSRDGLLKGGETGPAVVLKQPQKSLLLKALSYSDADLQMPPRHKLAFRQIRDFETWIKMGAPDPRRANVTTTSPLSTNLWSLKPITDPAVPKTKNTNWLKNPVDAFILAKLEEKNLTPVAPADKRTLIRRATFDLIGLPPTPQEIDAFLKDKSPKAFERVVDRLLASPHYGERWGRHWLDLVRYADTSGCNSDFPVPAAYRYRNYVIDSFNADKPYAQFIREQIAGDLLPAKNDKQRNEQIIATGYLAISRRFGSRALEFHLTLQDTIDNMGKTMLGLSVGCARCHDHKFDPIPTRDYYALYGIFNSTRYAFPGTEVYRHPKDFVPLSGSGVDLNELDKYEAELTQIDDELESLTAQKAEFRRFDKAKHEGEKTDEPTPEQKQKLLEIKAALEDARTRQKILESKIPTYDGAYAVSEGKPANAKIQIRGNPSELGAEAPRGFLQILGGQKVPSDEKGSGRRELAGWLTARNNPLTWRVIVNRIWEYHFGRGIVQTPNDFGNRGKAPTHPELLDYLASRFMQSGGSIKQMHRLIMLSQAYQMSAAEDAHDYGLDPDNSFLWRFNRQRLEAEEIRDAILAVSGDLDLTPGGPHPFPPESEWRYSQHKPFIADYETNRRSVYLMQQRIRRQPFLELFDGADTNTGTPERPTCASPLQALFLMNDPFVHAQSDKFAVRLALAHTKTSDRIDYAFKLALGRRATRAEIRDAEGYLKKCRAELSKAGIPAEDQPRDALASYARVLFSSNEFFFVE